MKFVSINGKSPAARLEQVVMESIAPDGGLYVPETIPRLSPSFLSVLGRHTLESVGVEICSAFFDVVSREDLQAIITRSWDFPIPLRHLEANLSLLELFHGPTLAFKDVGARFMAGLLSHLLAQRQEHVTILVATSGDTGSAVAHGFFNIPQIDVVILYPSGKISHLQEQQMTTLGGNIKAVEVAGTFDDCQRLGKQTLADPDIRHAKKITSANSINLARLLPQSAYYVWGMAQWEKNFRSSGGSPDLVVPSGNFGNITAALYAKRMGVPIGKMIAATNVNDVVPRYLMTGKYAPHQSQQTFSNAMDVGDPSNFARLLFLFGNFNALCKEIDAVSITDEETLSEIRRTYERTGSVIDPHTAVGVAAARRRNPEQPIIIAATAHPAKFPEVIKQAIGLDIPLPSALETAMKKPKQSIPLANDFSALKQLLLSS